MSDGANPTKVTTTNAGIDAKAERERRRNELRTALLDFGGNDVEALRDIIVELVEELPTPALELVVEHITAKQDALGETVMQGKLD